MLSQSLAEPNISKKVSGVCWRETLPNYEGFFGRQGERRVAEAGQSFSTSLLVF